VTPRAEGRHALIVATADYSDSRLQRLRAPAADAARLAEVLRDPAKGNFEVEVLVDENHATQTRRIASFFRDRRPEDLLLLHFSCHGVKDDRGELYLAAADSELDLLSATGVSAAWLNDQITRTRSRRTVVLLDCCFSGSFPFGMRPRGSAVDAPEQLQGRGRAIITASNAMEYAYEGDELRGEGQPSVFTEAVVEGLETGKADLDHDQLISVDDLYSYVYDRVKDTLPSQTPSKKSDLEGPLYLAKSAYRPQIEPATLDPELLARTEDRYAGIREGAVQELAGLLRSRHPPVVLAARHALSRMIDDDSRRVSAAVRDALTDAEGPQPEALDADAETAGPPGTEPALAPGRRSLHIDPPGPDAADEPTAQRPPLGPVPSEDDARRAPPEVKRQRVAAPRRRWLVAVASLCVIVGATLAIAVIGDGDRENVAAVPDDNLTRNPSFEKDDSHWGDSFNSLPKRERATDAPDGDFVARVSLTKPSDEYSIDDYRETVKSSQKGHLYTATAWTKAANGTAGERVCISLRESSPAKTGYVGVAEASAIASADKYQKVQVPYVALASGDKIGVHVFRHGSDLRQGEAFLVDAITISPGSTGHRNTHLVRDATCQPSGAH
jgi:hypothetical protein